MEIGLQLSLLNSEFWHPHSDECRWSSHLFFQWENSPTSHVIPIGSLMFPFSCHMLFSLVCSYCQSQPFLTYIIYNFFWAELSFFIFKMEAAVSWKTLMPVYQTACWDILLVYLFNNNVICPDTSCYLSRYLLLFAQIPLVICPDTSCYLSRYLLLFAQIPLVICPDTSCYLSRYLLLFAQIPLVICPDTSC
jgi:hypothetical protein